MVRLQKPSLGRWPFTSLGQRRMFSLLGVNHFSEAGAPPLTLLFSYTLYHFISCLLYGLVPHIMPYSEIFNLCPSWHLSLYLKPTSLTPNWGCWGMDTLTIANTVFLWQHLILHLLYCATSSLGIIWLLASVEICPFPGNIKSVLACLSVCLQLWFQLLEDSGQSLLTF